MKNKESFLLYKSFYDPIKSLSDKELGQLFRMIYEYQLGINNPNNPVGLSLTMAFSFFKNQFRLDEKKYQKVVDRNRKNGQKGGRPKLKKHNPNNPVGYKKPKKADNDNDNDKDKENDKVLKSKKTSSYKVIGDLTPELANKIMDNVEAWSEKKKVK